jgi:DNA-binding transcriptional ArsR family regulator
MDEIVIRWARTLACFQRLRILSRLAVAGETSPTQLGRELRKPLSALSGHLARLATAGLMRRRRSGRWSYCVADSPYGPATLSGMTASWLRKVLSRPKGTLGDCTDEDVHGLSAGEAETRVHKLVFEAATAFTDLRRLRILHRLGAGGGMSAEALGEELRMSEWAVRRHTDKLMRRGYLSVHSAGRRALYRLAKKFKTPIHGGLFEIVRSVWGRGKLYTS